MYFMWSLLFLGMSVWAETFQGLESVTVSPRSSDANVIVLKRPVGNAINKVLEEGIALGWAQCALCVENPDSKECLKNRDAALKTMQRWPSK